MAFDGRELYKFAGYVYDNIDNNESINFEAQCRTIVNRAYYGAFLVARNSAQIRTTGAGAHRDVIKHYRPKGQVGNRIANRLTDLFACRKTADYETNKKTHKRDATKSLRLSKEIIADIESE